MNKYFILATRRVELSGIITASSKEEAVTIAKNSWFIYDTPDNTITTGSTSRHSKPPQIAEMEDSLRILHTRDISGEQQALQHRCPLCGALPGRMCRSLITGAASKVFHNERLDLC